MAKLTKEQVKTISELARMKLEDSELEKFAGEIEQILTYVEKIGEVDVSDIEYASHIEDFVGERTRKDEPGEALTSEQIFRNAQDRKKGNNFLTSKIV